MFTKFTDAIKQGKVSPHVFVKHFSFPKMSALPPHLTDVETYGFALTWKQTSHLETDIYLIQLQSDSFRKMFKCLFTPDRHVKNS